MTLDAKIYEQLVMKQLTMTKEEAYEKLGLVVPEDTVQIIKQEPESQPGVVIIDSLSGAQDHIMKGILSSFTISDDFVKADDELGSELGSAKHTTWQTHHYYNGTWAQPVQPEVSGTEVMSDLMWLLPGLSEEVSCPAALSMTDTWNADFVPFCGAPHKAMIAQLIQHLNDHVGWSRERVADWLETLDVDLTFPTEPPPRPKPQPYRVSGAQLHMELKLDPGIHAHKLLMELMHGAYTSHVTYPKGHGKSVLSASYWLDEHFSFYEPEKPKPQSPFEWAYGDLTATPTTPQIPTYDPVRSESNDVPPDPLEDPGLVWPKKPVDYSKFSQPEARQPTKKKRIWNSGI